MATYPPTARQMELLRFVRGFQAAKGCSPTFEEMRAGIGAASKHCVGDLLNSMQLRGLVNRIPRETRSVHVLVNIAFPTGPVGEPLYAVKVAGC